MTRLGCFELQIGMYFSVEIAQAMDEKDGGGSGKERTKDYFDLDITYIPREHLSISAGHAGELDSL